MLSFDEVNTLLHEFGHSLHGMLAQGTYSSLSGTSVYRDFVELPSQIMENWLTEKEFLDQIAVHYQTGEKIPQEMIQSLVNASNFNAGYLCCRQLSFGLLDMAWHTLEQPFDGDVAAFEKKAWAPTVIMPEVPEALMGTSFGHIFSGGYAAGYYGYKWAEVLDADAFSVFKSKGIFNKEVAKSFRDNILSKGGTEDPAVLYKRFRGQEPTIDALLIRTAHSEGQTAHRVEAQCAHQNDGGNDQVAAVGEVHPVLDHVADTDGRDHAVQHEADAADDAGGDFPMIQWFNRLFLATYRKVIAGSIAKSIFQCILKLIIPFFVNRYQTTVIVRGFQQP